MPIASNQSTFEAFPFLLQSFPTRLPAVEWPSNTSSDGWLFWYSKVWINDLYLFLVFVSRVRVGRAVLEFWNFVSLLVCVSLKSPCLPLKMPSGRWQAQWQRGWLEPAFIPERSTHGSKDMTCLCHSGVWVRILDLSLSLKRGMKSWI